MNIIRIALFAFALLAVGATQETLAQQVQPAADIYAAAVKHSNRYADDLKRDADRHPAAVLKFFGIAPGMTVLDLFSGGGYYSELLSYVVGTKGKVVAQTNKAYESGAGTETGARYANGRLPNVEILLAENNELALPPENFDAILMVLSYHDIYYVDEAGGWPRLGGRKLLAELYHGAKPGATLGIVDHAAAPGSPRESGGTVHRIDPDLVIAEVEAAGFKLAGRSEVLRNRRDDYSRSVFEPDLRGKTDRFVLRFQKPL